MGRLLNIVTPVHRSSKRDCLARMVDDKVNCMLKAKDTSLTTGTAIGVTAMGVTSICRLLEAGG